MKRVFLYIDILAFESLVTKNQNKITEIFSIIDNLKVHNQYNLKVIVFSDTILVFTKRESLKINYYVNDLVEYTQELFYSLSAINVYFKAAITFGEFNYSKMKNIEAYHGLALIKTYKSTLTLEGFGLYIDKEISDWIRRFDVIEFSGEYDYILLCQSITNLYLTTNGILPAKMELLNETEDFSNLSNDLDFFRAIAYLKVKHPTEKVRMKYQKVYEIYKSVIPLFFKTFEKDGFILSSINSNYKENNPTNLPTKLK